MPSPRCATGPPSVPSPEDLDHLVRPAEVPGPEGMLVLFHGRGADEEDLFPLLDILDPERRLVGITPGGPLSIPPGGRHWYIVERVGYPDRETWESTFTRAGGWLEAVGEQYGIGPERTVLGGFSQGGVMAYALGLGKGQPTPRAIIALSSFIPTVDGFEVDFDRPDLQVAIGHGSQDPVIPVEFGRVAKERLEAAGIEPLYHESAIPHTIDPRFLGRLQAWVRDLYQRTS